MVKGVLTTLIVMLIIGIFTFGFIYLLVVLTRILKTLQKSVKIREKELEYLEKMDKIEKEEKEEKEENTILIEVSKDDNAN